MTRRFSSVLATLLAWGGILFTLAIQAAEPNHERQPTQPVFTGSEPFNGNTLGGEWSFDDPNHNDAVSGSARPGWLQIQISGPDEDMWVDDRGGAPLLVRRMEDLRGDFSLETHVDLATANGGYPVLNSIGGLVVCDAGDAIDASPFVLSFGLQHNWVGGTEVILQKPGKSFAWAGPGANAAYLRLDRNVTEGTWSGYYKNHADSAWILLNRVSDEDLDGGTTPEKLAVGLFAKTWDPDQGGPASIDFAYFGEEQPSASKASTAQDTSQEVEIAALQPFCVSGKERNVLNGYGEAELLRHSGKGCLTHMWFGGNWLGYERTV